MIKLNKKILFLSILLYSLLGTAFGYIIDFNDNLISKFGTGFYEKFSEVHFNSGGNNFGGIVFWLEPKTLNTKVDVTLGTNGPKKENCLIQIRGLYYNPQRGTVLWPLDGDSLNLLKQIDSTGGKNYDNISMTGGLYMGCDNNLNNKKIYGQVRHTLDNTIIYNLVAGVNINSNQYSLVFQDSLELINQIGKGKLRDSAGGAGFSTGNGITNMSPNNFSFLIIKSASLNRLYTSSVATISGIDGNGTSMATISKGEIIVNGSNKGTQTNIKNGDKIQIKLRSDNKYSSVISSTITIGSTQGIFYIITKDEGEEVVDEYADLTLYQKIKIVSIVNALAGYYEGNENKIKSFLYLFKSMLDDKIEELMAEGVDEKEILALRFLNEVIESKILNKSTDLNSLDGNTYIAPNCKKYKIEYNTERQAYYSSDFVKIHYFVTQDHLKKHIDENNQGQGNCNYFTSNDPNIHTAPNGKVYKIEKTNQGYISYDFTSGIKVFDSLDAIKRHINAANPAIIVRNHTLDTSYTAKFYITPNEKEYKIQKTDKGYMSYNLINPQYFSTEGELTRFLDKNNLSKNSEDSKNGQFRAEIE